MSRKQLVTLIILSLLIADQALKIWVKTHLGYGEELRILGQEWALIHFIENNGMAFGMSFGGQIGKFLLSMFRLLAVGVLFVYLGRLIHLKTSRRLLSGFAMVQAGALGNIIDSMFYGIFFSQSNYHSGPAEFLPEGGGYAPLFYGSVVDMLYFPISWGTYPEWLPLIGGNVYLFFRPVFNIADVAITFGVLLLLLAYITAPAPASAPEN